AFENVRQVPGRGDPRVHDRLRRGQAERAPGEVLADHIAHFAAWHVAGRTDAADRREAVGGDVVEVVERDHFLPVAFGGHFEIGVGDQRRLAVLGALGADEAQHGFADQLQVAGFGYQLRVLAGRGQHPRDRHSAGCVGFANVRDAFPRLPQRGDGAGRASFAASAVAGACMTSPRLATVPGARPWAALGGRGRARASVGGRRVGGRLLTPRIGGAGGIGGGGGPRRADGGGGGCGG